MITDNILYEIAKIVDSNFNGTEKTFTCTRKLGYYFLCTNWVDEAGSIKVFTADLNSIQEVRFMSEYSDGYELITENTKARISKHLEKYGIKFTTTPTP